MFPPHVLPWVYFEANALCVCLSSWTIYRTNAYLEDEHIVWPQVRVLAHLSHARIESVVDQSRRVDGWE